MPSIVAALITPLMPGAGPPPTRIASLPLFREFGISFGQQIAHQRPLFLEFIERGINLRAAEFVKRQAMDDFEFLAVAPNREGTDQALLDSVAAVRADTDAVPIAGSGRF